MIFHFLFVLVSLLVAGQALSAPPPSALVGPRFKVGSYNIRNDSNADKGTPNDWKARKQDLAGLLRRLDLDVVGLQEVQFKQADFLCKALPDYTLSGRYRNEGAANESLEGNPILYRTDRFLLLDSGTFWLSETPDVVASRSWNSAYPRICAWVLLKDKKTGAKLAFMNVHADHHSALAREKGLALVLERQAALVPKGVPVVLTGDFNCPETTHAVQAVSAQMTNALYASQSPPQGPWRTWNDWLWVERETTIAEALRGDGAERKSGKRIDYVFVSREVKVRACTTHADARPGLKLYPSDHFPVTAEIELLPPRRLF